MVPPTRVVNYKPKPLTDEMTVRNHPNKFWVYDVLCALKGLKEEIKKYAFESRKTGELADDDGAKGETTGFETSLLIINKWFPLKD